MGGITLAQVKWIKITTSMFEDEKIDYIESLPEADTLIVVWVKLLTLAGKCNTGGYIFLAEKIPYSAEMLAHKFRRPLNTVKMALEIFKNLGMIEIDEKDFLYISNWEKHQNIEGMDRIKELTRKRVAKHRAKKIEELTTSVTSNVEGNVTVTPSNAADIDIELDLDIDKDKELDKEIKIIMTPREAEFLSILSKVQHYPIDRVKDIEMVQALSERYPNLNLIETLKDWAIYKKDKPLDKKSNPRNQINQYFKKAVEWGKNLKHKGEKIHGTHHQDDRVDDPYADLPTF